MVSCSFSNQRCWGKVGWQEKMLGPFYTSHSSWFLSCVYGCLLSAVLASLAQLLPLHSYYAVLSRLKWGAHLSCSLQSCGWLPLALSLVSKLLSLCLCCLKVLISSLPLLNLLQWTCCVGSAILPGVRLKQGWKMEKGFTFLCPSIPTTYHWPAEQIYSINNHNSTKKDGEN